MRNNALLFSRRQFRLDEAKMRNDFSLTSLMMLLMMFSQRSPQPPTDWGLFLKFQNSNLGVQREIMLKNVSRYGLKLKILLIKIDDCYSKGRVPLPNRMIFWKSAKGGGLIFNPKLQILGTFKQGFLSMKLIIRGVISGFRVCFFQQLY